MAIKNTKVAAPVKVKTRKNHGPKRHLHHAYSKCLRYNVSYGGLLNKYNNYESFALAVMARGVKVGIQAMWDSYSKLPTTAGKDAYLENLSAK